MEDILEIYFLLSPRNEKKKENKNSFAIFISTRGENGSLGWKGEGKNQNLGHEKDVQVMYPECL